MKPSTSLSWSEIFLLGAAASEASRLVGRRELLPIFGIGFYLSYEKESLTSKLAEGLTLLAAGQLVSSYIRTREQEARMLSAKTTKTLMKIEAERPRYPRSLSTFKESSDRLDA